MCTFFSFQIFKHVVFLNQVTTSNAATESSMKEKSVTKARKKPLASVAAQQTANLRLGPTAVLITTIAAMISAVLFLKAAKPFVYRLIHSTAMPKLFATEP